MSKIIIGGAGGAPSENVIRSLKKCSRQEEIIGIGSEAADLMLSGATKTYHVPYAVDRNYKGKLLKILSKEKADFIHFQNDLEIREVSKFRNDILSLGTKLFIPSPEVIEKCVDKAQSYQIWKQEGLRVPKSVLITNEKSLADAFETLGNGQGTIWLRATIGGGGKGALPTNNYDFAKLWIDRFKGWGQFTAAELLTSDSVTWLSIWYEGELVVAQTRKRQSWNFGNRTLSGVTGITGVGETCSDDLVTDTAMEAIHAIDDHPHGIYGVDMTYDTNRIPNPTEINIARFFTTVHFFTEAGLNMPKIYKDIALYNEFPSLDKKINPLPDGLLWIRGMDREPVLTTEAEMKEKILVIE